MNIRKYVEEDLTQVAKLFYETVHTVCANDYNAAQLDAWAKSYDSLIARGDDFLSQNTLVAETNGKIVGFGSLDGDCLDMLYVHKDYLKRGVATALCNLLERGRTVKTYASVTARPFFEKRGYKVVKCREVERSGIMLRNFEMLKDNGEDYTNEQPD